MRTKASISTALTDKVNASPQAAASFRKVLLADSDPVLGWPQVLACIGINDVIAAMPPFVPESPLFAAIESALVQNLQEEVLLRLYDQVFVERLTQAKAAPGIAPEALLCNLRAYKGDGLFLPALKRYEQRLLEDRGNAMHDLILYLAWDRVCVDFRAVFDRHLPETSVSAGYDIFKGCLVESFQHILGQGRTVPSLYRLMEALYAYQMRDEKLQSYAEEEWQVLCRTATILRPEEQLPDVSYIDMGVMSAPPDTYYTMDTPEKVETTFNYARWLASKYSLPLGGGTIVCLSEEGGELKSAGTVVP